MNKVHILDCTLRDGGYCNEWEFGFENVKKITNGLVEANVEIIECGFITNKVEYNPDTTRFTTVEQITSIIPENRKNKIFVAMMNYGEYNIDDLPQYDGTSIDGIRVTFHKKNMTESLKLCEQIKAKGYLVFVQAMVSLSYSDEEFLSLIHETNKIEPYAFYIVDSFGMMKEKSLIRLFYMVEHNLKDDIWIGFHSHNNMQLAYSNAQELTRVQTSRNLIIDSSIMGMGRGAGNLNSELFLDFLNENNEKKYDIRPLLTIIDEILDDFYHKNYWGYSLSNYISAVHNAHPNYATYLDNKNTLTIESMNEIFDMMDEEKKTSFDKAYIEELYIKYQEKDRVQDTRLADFKERLSGKKVLLIAPGHTSVTERDKIVAYAHKSDVITISINYDYDEELTDFLFVSNLRRYRDLPADKHSKSVVTSNIPASDVYLQVRYKDLLNSNKTVQDNAGLMLIKLLINLGAKEIFIAGMDGYANDFSQNFAIKTVQKNMTKDYVENTNRGINEILKNYAKEVHISFITTPKFVNLAD